MSKKIIFTGAMGAILLSIGAAQAAVPAIASKGYVDTTKVGLTVNDTPGDGDIITGVSTSSSGITITRGNIADIGGIGVVATAGGDGVMGNTVIENPDGTVTIQRRAMTTTDIGTGTVTNVNIANDAVTSAKIDDGTVMLIDLNSEVTNNFATDADLSGKLNTGIEQLGSTGIVATVTENATGDVTVTRRLVDTADIAAGAVEANQINTDAVTTAKIMDGNVTAAKLADDILQSIGGIEMPESCTHGGASCVLTFVANGVDGGPALAWLDLQLGGAETVPEILP